MKFDFIVGNPPYQDETLGDNKTFAPPIYHQFLDEAYKVADVVELIHPARFLFNAGSTPKAWNQKMLNDPHIKVLLYKANVSELFPGTNINGGIAVTYRNANRQFTPIEVFTQFDELNHIRNKVCNHDDFSCFKESVFSAYSYHFTEELYREHPELFTRLSKGHEYDFKSNILELMPEIFSKDPPSPEYVCVLGRKDNNRTIMWTKRKYVRGPSNMDKYKVFLAGADGAAGTIGKPIPARVIGVPSVGQMGMCATESFVSIGSFDTEIEAKAAEKYLKTKFVRSMLSILKVTQAITPEKFKYVPLQDFSTQSDIDWSKSIPEIDQQIYAKYGLDQTEIDFIETHVKEMT